MAKLEFLQNVRAARNLLLHRVETDQPGLDPKKLETQLARAAIWLTPASVRGFSVRDFAELPPATRDVLKQNVERFLRVAEQVPPTKPATGSQVKEAAAAFRAMLKTLEPYLPTDDETQQIRKALRSISFPKNVVLTWTFEVGADSTGDPAIWIWVIVDDQAAKHEEFFTKTAREVEGEIRAALSAAGVARWPYIHFRTGSEQRALKDARL